MKKLIPFLFLISFSIAAQEYYFSNSFAMELSRPDESELLNKESIEWLLEKEKLGNQSLSILYNFGVEKTRVTRENHSSGYLMSEKELKGSTLSENTEFRRDGQILKNTLYDSKGVIDSVRQYFYNSGGELFLIETEDKTGELISSIVYNIRNDGSIRSVFSYENQTLKHSEIWNSYKGALFMEQRSHDSIRELVYYNQENQISKIHHYDVEQLIYEEIYTYSDQKILKRVEKNNILRSEKTNQTMNTSGDIIEETLYIDGILEHSIKYTYGGGRLIIKEKSGPSLKEKWSFFYKNDQLSEEEYYKQGILIQKKFITDWENNFYNIEFYNNGEVFLNLVYENDVKIRELFLENGQVVRFRDLGDL